MGVTQNKGKAMRGAAVGELIVEALSFYVGESADKYVVERLPSEHFRAHAQALHVRQHL